MATALTETILSSCLPSEFYIGKTRSECHVVSCDYSQGRMTWTTSSNKKKCPVSGIFYDSFFAFGDFAEKIDLMASRYTVMKEAEAKINRFAKLIQTKWPFNKFVLGCKVDDYPILLIQLNKNTPLVTLASIFEYDQQGNRKKVEEAARAMDWFLRKSGVFDGKQGLTLESLTDEILLREMDLIDVSYPIVRPKIHAIYHDEGKADVGTAISLADRASVPPILALRYLIEVEAMKDPEYVRRAIAEARLAKLSVGVSK